MKHLCILLLIIITNSASQLQAQNLREQQRCDTSALETLKRSERYCESLTAKVIDPLIDAEFAAGRKPTHLGRTLNKKSLRALIATL